MSTRVIAFSLWGQKPIYTVGALRNAELAEQIYPDWSCWFYVADSVPVGIVRTLAKRANVRVIPMGSGSFRSSLWRFQAIDDPDVSVMLSRDTDSRLNLREKSAVEEWLSHPEANFHIMRDNQFHHARIMAGMFGMKRECSLRMTELIQQHSSRFADDYGVDQTFLAEVVYPKVIHTAMVHDEIFDYEPFRRPFPAPQSEGRYVGQVMPWLKRCAVY